jgi:ABC-type nitrate/sulfonate/bicarbonate transport system permease component
MGFDNWAAFGAWRISLAYYIGVPNLGVAIGWPLGSAVMGYEAISSRQLENPGALAASILIAVVISLVFYLLFSAAARRLQAACRPRSVPPKPSCACCRARSSPISCSTRWPMCLR